MPKIVVAASSFFLALSLSGYAASGYAAAADQNRNSVARLPAAAQSSISAALGRNLPSYRVRTRGSVVEAENAQQKLIADFTSTGVEFHTSNTIWKLRCAGMVVVAMCNR
jgi:hypothetical protein